MPSDFVNPEVQAECTTLKAEPSTGIPRMTQTPNVHRRSGRPCAQCSGIAPSRRSTADSETQGRQHVAH